MDRRGHVLITGASTGIGRECALHLERAGFTVFASVRRAADADALKSAAENIRPLLFDVTDEASIRAAYGEVSALVGEHGLAGVVNNAGISGSAPIELHAMSEIRRMFDVNFFGALAVTQTFLPLVRAARGRIVIVGAAAGRVALPFHGAYSASKYAIEAIADALRVELAPFGIAVSVIEPGSIDTPIFAKMHEAHGPSSALYAEAIAAIEKITAETAKRGLPPAAVAAKVLDALTAKKPSTRYTVGRDAKLLDLVARKLPDRMRDAVLASQMGLRGSRKR